MDPAKFRLINLVGEGEENALGKTWGGVKAKETLQAALNAGVGKPPSAPTLGAASPCTSAARARAKFG